MPKLLHCISLLFVISLLHYQSARAQTSVDPAPLFNAAGTGNVAAIKKALDQGISVNAKDKDGVTALMLAASEGKLAAVQLLVKAGADVNAATKDGLTPLMSAAFSGSTAIVKFLLAEGASKTAKTTKELTAADIAMQAKKPEIVKLLAPSGIKAPSVKADSPKQMAAKEVAAVEAYQKERYGEAAGLFKELVELDPKHELGWHFLGKSLEKSGEKADAADAFQKSLEIQPSGEIAERNKRALTEVPHRWIKVANGCKLVNPNPQPNETVTWTGSCNQGYAEGEGLITWTVGDRISTDQCRLVKGKPEGRCVSTYSSGSQGESNYVNGEPISGRLQFKDGSTWEGTYANGKRTGKGKLTYPNGNYIYEGDFVDGKLHGKGKVVGRGQETFEGNFINGKPEGQGVRTSAGGTRSEGTWSNGKENGFFNVTFTSGTWYKGEYRDGKPNGPGTAFIAGSGKTYTGNWVNGCYADPSDMSRKAAIGVETKDCGW